MTQSQASSPNPSEEFDMGKIFRVLWYGKFWIVLSVVVFACLGAYYTIFVAEKRFSAVATVEFSPPDNAPLGLSNIVSASSTDRATLNTQLENIRAREMSEAVVAKRNLINDPFFNPSLVADDGPGLLDKVLGIFGITRETEAIDPAIREERIYRRVVRNVSNSYTVAIQRDTYLFDIRATADSPQSAADLANTLAETYIERKEAANRQDAATATQWLQDELRKLETDLRTRESDLADLQSSTDLISREGLEALTLQIKEFRDRLSTTRRLTASAQARLDQQIAARESGSKTQLLAAFGDDQIIMRVLAALNEDLSGDARAIAQLDQLLDTRIRQTRTDLARSAEETRALENAQNDLADRIEIQTVDLQKIEQMERELKVTRDLYQTFLTGLQEATVSEGLVRPEVRVMSAALPPLGPVSPRPLRIIAAMMLLGGVLACAVLLLLEATKRGVSSTEDLADLVNAPVMGYVPSIKARRRQKVIDMVVGKPTSAAAEAIRNLRTSIMMIGAQRAANTIMLTSSVPGEGKTTISLLLAHNYSGLGKRVLLLDCDIRRNTLSTYFGEASNPSGIMDVLEGRMSLQNAVHKDERLKIDVLLGQASSHNPADVFSSQAFDEMIAAAKAEYDVVIIDTAPVLVVTDARIIAPHADTIILATRWMHTPRNTVLESKRLIEMAGQTVTGFVLSHVDVSRLGRYGGGSAYSYGYYSYSQYYSS